MKRKLWLNYLPIVSLSICFAPFTLTQAYPVAQVDTAQVASDYNRYMKLGYTATAKRDYSTALINFRRAQRTRPGDHYAKNAVQNVSSYVARKGESKISVRPIGIGAPGNPVGGAVRRTNSCLTGQTPLTALAQADKLGLTTAEYPALFFYIPQSSPNTKVELALVDENDKQIGKTVVDAASITPGIVGMKLSDIKGLPPLEIGKNYHWYLSMICNPQRRSADVFVSGWVRRIELDPVLTNELKNLTSRDRASLYAVEGLWYDTLAALYEARRASPDDLSLANDWASVLGSESTELGTIAKEPLID